jgi:hypothetical protein
MHIGVTESVCRARRRRADGFVEIESAIRACGKLSRQASEIFSKLGVVKKRDLNQAKDIFPR